VSRLGQLFPLFPTPEYIYRSYLVTGERLIHVDRPALNAFLLIEWKHVLVTLSLFLFSVWALTSGKGSIVVLIGFIAFDVSLVWLIAKRMQAFYTRYVITTFRVMRVSGILTRTNVWIPWVKITDLTFSQTLGGRLFGYATIRIESANEESGLKDRILVEMINAKQGNVSSPNVAVID
jgi:uncharacterized membrane protein YdbT with pleckstrin-like domain